MNTYALIEDGIVQNIIQWDGVLYTPAVQPDSDGNGGADAFGWSPLDGQIAIVLKDGDNAHIGLGYADGVFEQPAVPVLAPPTPAETLASNTAAQAALINAATVEIAILTDATDPDIVEQVDPADTAALKAWKQYRVAVSKIDLTQTSVTWPNKPNASVGTS